MSNTTDAAFAARLADSLEGIVGLAVLGAARITAYQAAIKDAQALIREYRAANPKPAIEPEAQEPFDWSAHEYQG